MLLTCRKQWQQTCIQTPRLSHTAHSFNVCLPYTLRVTEWPLCASVYGHYKRGSHSVIRWLWELNIFPLFFYLCIYRRRSRWHPTPVLLPGKSHGQRSLVGCSPWGCQESDTTERLHFDFSLSCVGEGNGNPLQCSCLENPRDGGAWWAAVCGVAQSRTRLKQLSSISSSWFTVSC